VTVNLTQYLQKSGGVITGDIQSNNGSGYRTFDGLYSQVNISSANIQLLNGNVGGGTLTVEWDGITFADGKQTVKYPGAATLFANAALTGNPSAPTPDTSDNDTSIATTAFVKAQGYLTSAPVTSVAGRTGAITLSNTDISGLGSLAVVNDAPSNGSQYARKNAAWDVVIPGDRYLTTSTTSNTVSNGNKTFTIGTGLSYTPTQNITISYDASKHMHGEVLTYNSGTGVLTVDINHHTGSGTYAAWVVNVGGVTPATSVAWGAITGTLSTQTDLQNALDLKLDATTAASTYYLQTNPSGFIDAGALAGYATESWVSGQDYITNSAAASTYQTQAGMVSYATLGGSTFTGLVQVKASNGAGAGLLIPLGSTPSAPVDGEIWNAGSAGLKARLASVTETLANQSWVTSLGYATLASPTFTGTPTLPTGTIATTQSPGNNTTAVATTAFVTAAVPAFATSTQSRAATSTTVSQSPDSEMWQMMNPGFIRIHRAGHTYTATGTMGTATAGWYSTIMNVGAGIASAKFRSFGTSQVDQSSICVSRGYRSYIDFSRYIWCSGRFYTDNGAWSDPNVSARFYFGKAENSANGDPARKCFGWSLPGNATAANRNPVLQVHNGTTLTSVATTFAVVGQQYFDWDIVSLGNGTVTLYINGTQYATTSAGPTGDTSYSGSAPVIWQEELVATAVPTLGSVVFSRGQIYIAP
jgi:hypothetical protein